MQEFTSVSASDPTALAALLTERSGQGWSVVSIVTASGELSAILSREIVTEAGWAAAHPTPQPAAQQTTYTAQASAQPVAQQATAQPSVPAQWAADPRGRYDLRYWDGTRWTEHVSRGGQQYVDPL